MQTTSKAVKGQTLGLIHCSKMAASSRHTDWSKCCLCQEDTDEQLTSPFNTRYQREEDGYSSIAKNIPLFHAINALPIMLDPSRLDGGGGIASTLRNNRALYHESCIIQFNNTKLHTATKRASTAATDTEETQSKMQRTSQQPHAPECFLCDATGSTVREAMTMKLNKRLNECAKTLNDGRLIAILSAGDAVAQELKYHPACLAALYNRERSLLKSREYEKNSQQRTKKEAYPIAFSELVAYITEQHS